MIRKLGNSIIGLVLMVWLTVVFLPSCAQAQGTLMQLPPLTTSLGTPIAGATINVFTTTGNLPSLVCAAPVTVYKDVALTLPFTTLTTDGAGNYPFFISPSANPYGLTVSGAGTATSQCYGFSAPIPPLSSPTFLNVTVTANLSAERFRGACDAFFYAGLDAGAQINAAEADSACTSVEAINFTSPTAAATINATKPLRLGAYTLTGGAGANPVISVGTQSVLSGQGMLATIVTSSSNTADVVKIPSTSVRWSVHDLQITQPSTRSAGAALRVSGGNGTITNIYIPLFFDGMFFDTAVTAGLNMVSNFYLGNATDTGTPHCGIRNGGVSSGTVSSNQFSNGAILENANYSDAMICIQDGSDTILFSNVQAVWDVVHAGTVAFHSELVNGGIEPYDIKFTNSIFEAGASANVMVFDSIRAFECTNCSASGGLDGVRLNGGVTTGGGGEWQWIGGKISNNHAHGLDIETGGIGDITVIGTRFADNGQNTNNTFDDIFNVGAGNVQLIGNEFNKINSSAPPNNVKWNIEIASGNCGNYTIVANNYAQAGVSGTISNGCTAANGLSLDANSGTWNIISGLLRTPKHVTRVTSDFTSANSAALQAITGLSFSIPALATNYAFHCAVRFSQATNVAGDQFGVASLTTAPTLLSVDDAKVAQTVGPGATIGNGILDGFSTTTPTAFVTFTPGITGQLGATFDGVLEASGLGASTLQFYVLNGTAADVIVVKKDSFCTLAAQ